MGSLRSAPIRSCCSPTSRRVKSFTDFTDKDQIAVPATTSPQAIVMRMAAEKNNGAGRYGRADKMLGVDAASRRDAALLSGPIISSYVATTPFIAVLEKSDKVHTVTTADMVARNERRHPRRAEEIRRRQSGRRQGRDRRVEDAMASSPRSRKAADIYIKAQSSKTPKDQVLPMLKDGSIVYSVTPAGVMKYATFMAKTGELKTAPKSWHCLVRGRADLGGAARLLAAEIVRRHADDHQPALVIARPQFLQAGILRRVAAKRRGIDHHDRFAGVIGKTDRAALQSSERERVGGHRAHNLPPTF